MVQGQIGGESRPGSMSNFAKANALPQQQRCCRGTGHRARLDAIDCRGEPSGRLLESRREARPRGMIAAACRRLHQHAAQNPAYRPVRHFSITYGQFWRNCAITVPWVFVLCSLSDLVCARSSLYIFPISMTVRRDCFNRTCALFVEFQLQVRSKG